MCNEIKNADTCPMCGQIKIGSEHRQLTVFGMTLEQLKIVIDWDKVKEIKKCHTA